jgi:protein-tyrosine phosphatase
MRPVPNHSLSIGSALDARDLTLLYQREIAAVIDLALEERPAQLGREIVYCRFPLVDGAGNQPATLRAAVETTVRLLHDQTNALVACGAGMSRSPAVVAVALAQLNGTQPEDELQALVAGQPHDVSPLFWNELQRAVRSERSSASPPAS